MEKFISKFNISSRVIKGRSKKLLICPICNHHNIINIRNKLNYSKINTLRCFKCGQTLKTGDIFNFRTGTKLNNLNTHHNQEVLDEYIWNENYDKI